MGYAATLMHELIHRLQRRGGSDDDLDRHLQDLGMFQSIKRKILYLFLPECEMVGHTMIGATIGARLFATLVFRNCHIKALGCLTVLIMAPCFTYAKPWRGIVPLHTTRVAVEQKFGRRPIMDRGDTVVYDFENERASIEYSRGPCSNKLSHWDVPRDVVISIWITPKTDLKAADFNLDKNYKKMRDEHRPQLVHYINEEVGIEYNVDEPSGIVGLIKYLPSAAERNLRCPAHKHNVKKNGKRLLTSLK